MQPNLKTLAPEVLNWYFERIAETGSDWFILPPSGALYAYPGSFDDSTQREFVALTNEAAQYFNTSASSDWEFFGGWDKTVKHYLPRYINCTGVKLFFLDQVTYPLPIFESFPKVLGSPESSDSVVLVQPATSVATGGTWDSQKNAPLEVARTISKLERGKISYL